MDEISLIDYATPVYKVLLKSNQLLGIGQIPCAVIFILTIVLMNTVSIYCVVVGVIMFIVARMLCKKDPYMLSILFERLLESEVKEA